MTTEPQVNATTAGGAATGSGGHSTETSWATGLARFAGMAMALLGVLQIVVGTGALFRGEVAVQGLVHVFSLDPTAWGWTHLVVGALIGLAGMAVITGMLWGRVVGIALAAISLVACFLSAAEHPVLSIVGIVLAVAVLWALCVFDEKMSAASPTMLD